MNSFTAKARTFSVEVDYPDGWDLSPKPVPLLVVPRQLFGISNRRIQLTPTTSSQPRPMIAPLDSGAMFLWCYYQTRGDPDPAHPDSLPDYRRYSLPFRYRDSEVFQSFDAREWDARKFLWRRVGYDVNGTRLTLWIWEGTLADTADISQAEAIVSSVRIV